MFIIITDHEVLQFCIIPHTCGGIDLSENIDYFLASFSLRSLRLDTNSVTFVRLRIFYLTPYLYVSARAAVFESRRL